MGNLDWLMFKIYVLINTLGGEFEYVQLQVHASANEPGFSASTVVVCILQENDCIKCQAEGGNRPIALISQTGRCEHSPLLCTHCKCTSHLAKFCISHGGKFTGHTLEEACIAQHAVLNNNNNRAQKIM